MKKCPGCKTEVIDTAKFCHICRYNIKKYEENIAKGILYCTECGEVLQPNALFCTECGADAQKKESAVLSIDEPVAVQNLSANVNCSANSTAPSYSANTLECEDFTCKNGVLLSYNGRRKSIVIHDVEEIDDSAFENNSVITLVEIASGVKIIGKRAFANCSSLVELTLPRTCKIIFDDAFENTKIEKLFLAEYDTALINAVLSDTAKCQLNKIDINNYIKHTKDAVRVSIGAIEKKAKEICDTERELQEQKEKKRKEMLSRWGVGKTISFGRYRFSSSSLSKEPIEWNVLDVQGDKALIITRDIIDFAVYNRKMSSITWETSAARQWLNKTFYTESFSEQEKSMILTTNVINSNNPKYKTNGGNNTNDKVFLLSIDEANKYFQGTTGLKAVVTDYAKTSGGYKRYSDANGYGYWWLRSPGKSADFVAYVYYSGGVSVDGFEMDGNIFGFRPAMWVNLA